MQCVDISSGTVLSPLERPERGVYSLPTFDFLSLKLAEEEAGVRLPAVNGA